MDEGRVIGFKNQIPWHIPDDLKRFALLTTGHTVVMGRKTYESLPAKFRPLPKRKNVIISRGLSQLEPPAEIEVWSDPQDFIAACLNGRVLLPSDKLWIIGGAELYQSTINFWDEVMLTLVPGQHQGDAYFPKFEQNFELVASQDLSAYRTLHYRRI